MAVIVQLRRGTAAQWISANTLLAQGEEGLELETGKRKIGDGVTHWNDLEYMLDNTFYRPKGILTTADIGEFVQDNSGVTEVCSQTAAIPGTYNTLTVEILDFPVAGLPTIFTCEILNIPDIGSNQLNFIGGAPYIPYGGADWAIGLTVSDVASNLATAWNNLDPNDNGNHYIAVAVGATVTFTAQTNRFSQSSSFQWVGNASNGRVTQVQVGNLASTFYFSNFSGDDWGAQKCVYGDNWTIGGTLVDVAANLASCWNALSPAPLFQKMDYNANPIGPPTPWNAAAVGTTVTLTQTQIGNPGDPGMAADNYPTPPTMTLVSPGSDYIPPSSTFAFLGQLKGILGLNAIIERPPIFTAIAKGAIDAVGGDGNNNGLVVAVDGTHVEMRGSSPCVAGKALFSVGDEETVYFK